MKKVIFLFVTTLLSMLVAASIESEFGFYHHGPGDT